MTVQRLVADNLTEIRAFADAPPQVALYQDARGLVDRLCGDLQPRVPDVLCVGATSTLGDYYANWDHQVWYHLGELVRLAEGRQARAAHQGGDSWVNAPQPAVEQQMQQQIAELAKLRQLYAAQLRLVPTGEQHQAVDDPLLDGAGRWQHAEGLALQRDAQQGVCWQGQHPGGDWLWLSQPLPSEPLSIAWQMQPVSTIKGGLIAAFCVKPLDPATPLSVASSHSMADYYANFDAYHFSVNRGASGYCNLRRCGPGLVMLASFPDPCAQYGRWYSLEIVKAGPQVELRVDDRLAVCYVDLGIIQPALAGGHFGLRHFQGFCGWHRGLRIDTFQPAL